MQRRQPFHQSGPEQRNYLRLAAPGDKPVFYTRDQPQETEMLAVIADIELTQAAGVSSLLSIDMETLWVSLAEHFDLTLEQVSRQFGELMLKAGEDDNLLWHYHPLSGAFRHVR